MLVFGPALVAEAFALMLSVFAVFFLFTEVNYWSVISTYWYLIFGLMVFFYFLARKSLASTTTAPSQSTSNKEASKFRAFLAFASFFFFLLTASFGGLENGFNLRVMNPFQFLAIFCPILYYAHLRISLDTMETVKDKGPWLPKRSLHVALRSISFWIMTGLAMSLLGFAVVSTPRNEAEAQKIQTARDSCEKIKKGEERPQALEPVEFELCMNAPVWAALEGYGESYYTSTRFDSQSWEKHWQEIYQSNRLVSDIDSPLGAGGTAIIRRQPPR